MIDEKMIMLMAHSLLTARQSNKIDDKTYYMFLTDYELALTNNDESGFAYLSQKLLKIVR